jgi:Tol biopolymer transport system component
MSTIADRLSAALSDRYRIERELGAGGMATVYLAHDVRHDRPVALKVLRPELAAVMGADRFLAEVRTTANLQHPHILPLFDSGEADSFLYYVMPYVQGESLRERLDRDKQLPIPEAVSIARAVAGALDYAHRQGVIHRDIKPANILLQDGQPVVADFGIALAVSAAGGGRLTETGLSLGTPYYMSPEQATADRDPGPASDVYSLACVLYEMIAGDPPHTGSTAQAVLARILTDRPRSLTDFRETVPANVAAAVARALAKVPADRFESAAAFAAALEDAGFTYTPAGDTGGRPAVVAGATVPSTSRRTVTVLAALLILATAAGVWGWLRPAPEVPRLQARLDIQLAPANGPDFALSPDGTRIVYRAGGETPQLMLRSLGSLQSQAIPGTEGARGPAFSPNGLSVAFNQGSPDSWHTVALSGGSPISVGTRGDPVNAQASWGDDDFVYYYEDGGSNPGIYRASSQGGAAERIPAKEEYTEPATIPGVTDRILARDRGSGYGILDVGNGAFRPVKGLEAATYVAAAGDYLFWVTGDHALVAARFDVRGEKLASPPVTLAQGVADEGFAVSQTGTLVYTTGDQQSVTSLVWMDDTGRQQAVDARLTDAFPEVVTAAISPDGAHLALTVSRGGNGGGDSDVRIVVYDARQKSWQQLTFEGDLNFHPAWLPDGRIVFQSNQDSAATALWVKPFDRSAEETLLFRPSPETFAGGWDASPVPGAPMIVGLRGSDLPDGGGFFLVDPTPGAKPRPFLTTRFQVARPMISPDGRWVAYMSAESGQPQVYVRRYPGGGPPYPVSLEQGSNPVWGPTSADLYYLSATSLVEAHLDVSQGVRVTDRKDVPGDPLHNFSLRGPTSPAYDVGKDGRILAISVGSNAGQDSATVSALPVIVQDVFREVRERLAGQGGR